MKERRCQRVARAIARDLMPKRKVSMDRAEAREEQLHHERRTDGVREARVLRPRKCERRHSELTHATKPLKLRRIHERLHDALFFRLERDEAMHRITENHARARSFARSFVAGGSNGF